MQVKISLAIKSIAGLLKARLVPMLIGPPGMGKSSIIHQLAKDYGLKVIDLRLAQCDPTDLLGFPTVKNDRAGYSPMDTFPIEGDPIPDGYNGWCLFLDEFNSSSPAVQAAAYKLVLDRMVGQHHLHKNVAIVCAGNRETDNAIVQPMSTALQSRLVHLELILDHNEWIEWAQKKDFHHYITDYIQFMPGKLYTFRPDHSDHTYGCPRTWEFADRVMKITSKEDPIRLPMLAGCLSEGLAREFVTYCNIYDELPKFSQMLAYPDQIKIPKESSILYALSGTISHNASKDNITQLMKCVTRLPREFQAVTMKECLRRHHDELSEHPVVRTWVKESAPELF